jgi:energy-coupling factor transport system permease protein
LDSRAKLIVVLALLVLGLLSSSMIFSAVASALLIAAIVSAGVGGRQIWEAGKSIILLAAVTFLFHLFFTESAESPLIQILGISVTQTALLHGAFYALRLVLFVLTVLFLTMTTSPTDLAEGVIKMARPLRKLRVPIDDIGLILSLALRFIPILRDELTMIRRAQTLRGVSFSGSFMRRIRMTIPLLVPVFVSAVGRADTIALAIEARGFCHGAERTYFSRLSFGTREWMFIAAVLIIIAAVFAIGG